MKPILYLSGPMSGLPNDGRDAFLAAKAALEGLGYNVVSPVDIGDRVANNFSYADPSKRLRRVFAYDVQAMLLEAEMVVLLPGWENSKGAQIEYAIAKLPYVNMPVVTLAELLERAA